MKIESAVPLDKTFHVKGYYHGKEIKFPELRNTLTPNIVSARESEVPRKGSDAILHKFWGNFVSQNRDFLLSSQPIWHFFQGDDVTFHDYDTKSWYNVQFETDLRAEVDNYTKLKGEQLKRKTRFEITGRKSEEDDQLEAQLTAARDDIAYALSERLECLTTLRIEKHPNRSVQANDRRRAAPNRYTSHIEFCTDLLCNICEESAVRFGGAAGHIRRQITHAYAQVRLSADKMTDIVENAGLEVVDLKGLAAKAIFVSGMFSFKDIKGRESRFPRGGVLVLTEKGLSAINSETFKQAFGVQEANGVSTITDEVIRRIPRLPESNKGNLRFN